MEFSGVKKCLEARILLSPKDNILSPKDSISLWKSHPLF